MSDYLWDRSGPPDAGIAHLERALAAYRGPDAPPPAFGRRMWLRPALAAAACVVVAAGLAWRAAPPAPDSAWTTAAGARVKVGEWVRPAGSGAVLEAAGVGRLEIDEGSEVRVTRSAAGLQLLEMPRGRMRALVWAPPRVFAVDTPAARAIDLGCRYELTMEPSGDGLLTVETGWVAFERGGLLSYIPAGAACRTRRGRGPGTPYFTDAPAPLRAALDRYDESGDEGALREAAAAARPRDALTLWHLLSRAQAPGRAVAYGRLASLATLPREVSRERVLAGDPDALRALWEAVGEGPP